MYTYIEKLLSSDAASAVSVQRYFLKTRDILLEECEREVRPPWAHSGRENRFNILHLTTGLL